MIITRPGVNPEKPERLTIRPCHSYTQHHQLFVLSVDACHHDRALIPRSIRQHGSSFIAMAIIHDRASIPRQQACQPFLLASQHSPLVFPLTDAAATPLLLHRQGDNHTTGRQSREKHASCPRQPTDSSLGYYAAPPPRFSVGTCHHDQASILSKRTDEDSSFSPLHWHRKVPPWGYKELLPRFPRCLLSDFLRAPVTLDSRPSAQGFRSTQVLFSR